LLDFEPKSHAAERELGYRTRARLHVDAKRGRVAVGIFARRSHEPVPVDTCVVLDPILDRARDSLAFWLEGARGRGEAHLSLGRPSDKADQGLSRRAVLDLSWTGELPDLLYGKLERATQEGALAGARIFAGDVRVPATIGDPTPFIVGPDGLPLRLAPGGFSQATEAGNTVLAQRVAALVRELPPGPCLELYAGAGNLTVLLARDREVVAVEQDRDACAAARENLRSRSLAAKIVEGNAAAAALPKGTKVVVLDPPREGARAACEALAKLGGRAAAPAIVYVSCDPPTLARDVRILTAGGAAVTAVETFEMFPHTSHVETVAVVAPAPRRS
jgi:23S rRNA (uracil1939-C5)-methyltransferase